MYVDFVSCDSTKFINSNSFLMEYLGPSVYKIISSATDTVYLFPIWITFISFCCLITLCRTSGIMLCKNGQSELPWFVLDLRGKAISFSLSVILDIDLSYRAFIMLRYSPSILCLEFFSKRCWGVPGWLSPETFVSGHGLAVREFKPSLGSVLTEPGACFRSCVSFPLCLSPIHTLPLKKMNKC